MNLTEETLDLIKTAQVTKAFTQATGLVNYDLEAPAKRLYPVLTPLRNMISRSKGAGDTATRWKAITAINATTIGGGVEEGKRGGVQTQTLASYTAAYKGLGIEDSVTFEAQYASENFDDARARAVDGTLQGLMLVEEQAIYGGNAGYALGIPATPTGVASGVGTVSAAAQLCSVVALTPDGYNRATKTGNFAAALSASRTNADATTTTVAGGHSDKSAASSAVTPSGSQLITWTVAALQGAAGYAWFVGVSGSQKCIGITTVNKIVQTANAPSGAQALTAITADDSQDATVFDGLFSFYGQPTLNGYSRSLDGATLTSDGAGGCVEIDVALQSFWDTYRLSPTRMIVAAAQALKISTIVTANGTAPIFRFDVPAGVSGQRGLVGGTLVRSYLNKFFGGGVEVEIMLHPNAIPGTIMFDTDTLPYQNTNIPAVRRIKTRQEYYQTEWPLKTRKYEFGVYCDELMQHYAPFAGGLLQNVG